MKELLILFLMLPFLLLDFIVSPKTTFKFWLTFFLPNKKERKQYQDYADFNYVYPTKKELEDERNKHA